MSNRVALNLERVALSSRILRQEVFSKFCGPAKVSPSKENR